jgi:hypothetical protein
MTRDARLSDPARFGERELLTPREAAAYFRARATSTSCGSVAADRDSIPTFSETLARISISERP